MTASQVCPESEAGKEGNPRHGARLGVVVVVADPSALPPVVDVLHVEVGAELPLLELPRLVDADVELREEREARAVLRVASAARARLPAFSS